MKTIKFLYLAMTTKGIFYTMVLLVLLMQIVYQRKNDNFKIIIWENEKDIITKTLKEQDKKK